MAAPATWTDLKITLEAWAVRDDLEDRIPEAISLAEVWFQRELFSPEREEVATLTVTNGVASLPSDFGGVKMVYVDGSPDTVLLATTPDQLRDMYPTTDADTPCHYAIEGETMLFGPIPTSGLVIKLRYIEGILALGSGQATNWLLTDHPDIYIHASLAEIFDWARNYEAADRSRGHAAAIADSINRAGRRRKTNSGPLVARARSTDQTQAYRL